MYLEVLPLSRRDILPAQRLECDRIGVAIWNCCCRLRQSLEECHNPTDMAKAQGLIDIGGRIVEHMASKLEIQLPSEPDHLISNEFRTQYLLLRIFLVWHNATETATH
ncbi:uncharacterized protein A1O9_12156 [Exophiala aquamarina CBS 119918]|uniref:Uncharacterized protein n=1 Tax=Exophiala aquamarina CBS 119918 TaxID=1182545 RepID=A0A072NVD8_9EURO|nr:uncharacterized protein A1O9_12156 [Exophiala aquamarina CBS 119918]KEF51819.1 hypothetical protein A1O9_12156 [Exophiala aquamarina CBS 119918]